MINIFINPERPALAIAVAAFINDFEKKYGEVDYEIIPITALDLAKNLVELKFGLHKEIKTVVQVDFEEGQIRNNENDYFDSGEEEFDYDLPEDEDLLRQLREENPTSTSYYALFGIYPQGKEEEHAIFNFVESKAEKILLWVDYHFWPENLVSYLKSLCDKIVIKNNVYYSDLLEAAGLNFSLDWREVERAIMTVDFDNPLSARYWEAFLVSKAVGDNLGTPRANDCLLFSDITNEIIYGEMDNDITSVASYFEPMLEITGQALENFRDDHPVFIEAKKMGRQVGYLDVGEIEDYFNFYPVLAKGIEDYPWLVIVAYKFEGRNFQKFCSAKLPIASLAEYYVQAGMHEENLLKALNAELIRFKEES